MTARPLPPFLPENAESFKEHVPGHLDDWFDYFRNVYIFAEEAQNVIHSLRKELDQTRSERDDASAEARVALKQLKDKDQQILDANLALRAAQQASLPTVRVLTPDRTQTPLAGETTAPHLGTTPPPPAEPTSSTRLSERQPDPEKFDGSRSDLRRFTQQTYAKMTANADRYPTATSRLTYVAGRLTGKAYDLILPKTVFGVPGFTDYPQMLNYLENAFGDPDRVQNAQNRLYRLRQTHQDFSSYFSEFQRLALEGEMPDGALTPLLFQGISRELQDMLLHSPAPSREFQAYANHLQMLDNRYRQHQQQIGRPREPWTAKRTTGSGTAESPRKDRPASRGRSPPKRTPTPPGDRMDLSNQRRSNARYERGECFRCGSKDHMIRNCPKPDTRPARIQQARLPSPGKARTPSRTSSQASSLPGNGASLT